jgi:hypothetical protein
MVASKEGLTMPITDVSMRDIWGAADAGARVLSATLEMKWPNKPRHILATVALTELQAAPWATGDPESLFSLGGFWIIGWEDETGYHDHPEGHKAVWVNHCKRVTFDVDVYAAVVNGLCRVDYWD